MTEESKSKAEVDRLAAERDKFILEAESFKSERQKYEAEIAEINSRLNKPWYQIRLGSIIQAIIGGIVAGALIWSFAIGHITKLYDLQEKLENENTKLQEEIENLRIDKKSLSEGINDLNSNIDDSRNIIISLQSQIDAQPVVKEHVAKQLKNLSEVQQNSIQASETSWFPVVASAYNEKDLRGRLNEIREKVSIYKIEIYQATDSSGTKVYAVTLGGYLNKEESRKRVTYAHNSGIADDAYSWNSSKWGEDISGQF